MEQLLIKVAGEITLSSSPGASLKKWREIFGVSQTELSEFLGVTPSTISDYEANRRKSPGIAVIKRFVNALMEIDRKRGGWVVKKLDTDKNTTDIFSVLDFSAPLNAEEFVKKVEGRILANGDGLKGVKLNGYTLVDSLRAILELPAEEFIQIYGTSTERALLFTNVSMGRSPMVAIRVTKLKPNLVVLHNVVEVDRLAVKIAEIEKIPLVTTVLPMDEIKRRLSEWSA